MNQNPLVTVAIVFYNAMPHFKTAVGSVLNQTFSDWELLLVNDGSTDGSLEFAKSINDPRVRVISDGRNLKLNVRLNETVRAARGQYYFRMDADDIMFPDRIERQMAALQDVGENVVIGSSAVVIDDRNRILGERKGCHFVRSVRDARHAFIHPTVCARVEWFRRHPYSEDFAFHRSQDAELWTRTYAESRFVQLRQPLLFYRDSVKVKVDNYIGSALGMCIIAYRQRDTTFVGRYIWLAAELLRCWCVCLSADLSMSDIIVRRRNRPLKPELIQQYDGVLRDVLANEAQCSNRLSP